MIESLCHSNKTEIILQSSFMLWIAFTQAVPLIQWYFFSVKYQHGLQIQAFNENLKWVVIHSFIWNTAQCTIHSVAKWSLVLLDYSFDTSGFLCCFGCWGGRGVVGFCFFFLGWGWNGDYVGEMIEGKRKLFRHFSGYCFLLSSLFLWSAKT